MALTTRNIYGNISVSDDAVSMLIGRVALECYGVYDLASCRLSDSILMLFNKVPLGKGVKLVTMDNRVFVDLFIILKNGVNKDAVLESLKSAVEYNVEYTTGMRVKSVTIHIVGIKI